MNEIYLTGNKQDLIYIIESHIAYLKACGYDNSDDLHCGNSELNICYNFLMQLDETSEFLTENNKEYENNQ